jgi:aspartyl protease family protein
MFSRAPLLATLVLCLAVPVAALAGTERLPMSDNGHFVTRAQINGRSVPVIVDTGASTVALSYEDAERVGFRPDDLDFNRQVSTANGVIKAAAVKISQISVGSIRAENIDAIVMPKGALFGSLLGMSFLSGLHSYEVRDRVLYLRD